MRNDIGGEIAFTDEERNDENFRFRDVRQHVFDLRFLFPERLAHFGEEIASPLFGRVLVDGRGRIVVPS